MCALVLISPATTHRPVVTSVSHATRPYGSSVEDRVEDAVADLVGHLVGVTLGDRLGRERVLAQLRSPLSRSASRCVVEMLGGRPSIGPQARSRPARGATSARASLVSSGSSSTPPAASSSDGPVGVDLESGVGGAHVVGDHEVDPLRRELGRRVLADPLGLGREPDHDLARPLAARRARRGCRRSARARSRERRRPS